MSCHEYAVGFFRPAADPAPELVQLAQPESFGAFYDHHGSIRDIYTHFNHRSGHKDVRPACGKCVHIEFLVLVALLPVHDGRPVRRKRECRDYLFISLFKVPVVHLLTFEYERVDHKYLSAEGNLVFHEFVEGMPFPLGGMHCQHGLPARRKFIDDRHVKVSVQGHGKCPRYRSGGHHQNVRRHPA